MKSANIDSISQEQLRIYSDDIHKVLKGDGVLSYQTALSKTLDVIQKGFSKKCNELKQIIRQLKELEKEHDQILNKIENCPEEASCIAFSLNKIASEKVNLQMRASLLEKEIKIILSQNEEKIKFPYGQQ